MNIKKNIEDILGNVRKPTRYSNNEWNSVHKSGESCIQIALAFPDLYEIGMSHLGMNILYHLLNEQEGVVAERVYAPWMDMEDNLRRHKIDLSSLESGRPLKEFDIIGFSVQYEMAYTNILNMLELAQIPLKSSERSEKHPLIIAGGVCVYNPEPLSAFIDVFVIGEAEEAILEIVSKYQSVKESKLNRQEILKEMARIEGVYVPSLYEVSYNRDNTIKEFSPRFECAPPRIKKRFIEDLDASFFPSRPLVPFQGIVHDRGIIEVLRGCARGCRFCQAGITSRPMRCRSAQKVKQLISDVIENSGWEEISFLALNACDYPRIKETAAYVKDSYGKRGIRLSLPSIRLDRFSLSLAKIVAPDSRARTTLTFAPEAGTQRMRDVINKGIDESLIFDNVLNAFRAGWNSCKLYFMIGLPGETDDDVKGIVKLVRDLKQMSRNINRKASLRVGISAFVPKAHTPFQWEAQDKVEDIERKQKYIIRELRGFEVRWHRPQVSMLEAVFARGDRRLGEVILNARREGARFDSWEESFNYGIWEKSFEKCGIDPSFYLGRKDTGEILPWDHIDTMVKKEFLIKENRKAKESLVTASCISGGCNECGACGTSKSAWETENQESAMDSAPQTPRGKHLSDVRQRIRINFSKGEKVKFISHLDLQKTLIRALRRAQIPFALSGGFHPNPKLIPGLPLSVGMVSNSELWDLFLAERMDLEEFTRRLSDQLPQGIMLKKTEEILLSAPALSKIIKGAVYTVALSLEKGVDPQQRIGDFLGRNEITVHRKTPKTDKMVDLRPLVSALKLLEIKEDLALVEVELKAGQEVNPRVDEVVRVLFGQDARIIEIRRTCTII